ncbi:MAG: hypothetical protein LBC61_00975 [Candidatus Peribacteria bacterium]|nr:hypothetical protein [Candidatus Peribacteria bacterium]
MEYVNNLGLNLECSANFFKNDDDKFLKYLNFVSSHPTNEKRLKNILAKNENKDVECRVLEYEF